MPGGHPLRYSPTTKYIPAYSLTSDTVSGTKYLLDFGVGEKSKNIVTVSDVSCQVIGAWQLIKKNNEAHIKDIAYKSNGIMYTLSGNDEFEKDINETLCLNGLRDKKGNLIDTSTEIVKGRRDAV